MSDLYIYSGKCVIGKVGDKTNITDSFGEKLFVGDIVVIHTPNMAPQLTVISDEKYQSYHDGTIKIKEPNHFVMGIKDVDYHEENSGWTVTKVKSFADLIEGEKWARYNFSVGKLNGTIVE
jgi:hypothetical protein